MYAIRSYYGNRCPLARLIAVRLTDTLFLDSDGAWDCVWRPLDNAGLVSFLIDQIPDEYLGLTRFVEWPPAAQKWPEEFARVRNAVRSFLDVQKRVMLTRTAFGPRWLKNAFDVITSYSVHYTKLYDVRRKERERSGFFLHP